MLATFMLGMIADKSPEAFALLLETVSTDPDRRVQEVLAQAFDQYCTNEGYAPVLSVIEQWLDHTNPNVRRAAVEGPRSGQPGRFSGITRREPLRCCRL